MPARRVSPVLAACAVVLALVVPLLGAPPAAGAAGLPPVVVTEIVADNADPARDGADTFEYVEVHNTTDAPLDLAAAGISFSYIYADSADRSRDVALTAEPLVLAAGETALLWVSYTTPPAVDSFAVTVADFRTYHSVAATTQVVRLTGQPGIANGGNRGIRVLADGEPISWSFAPSGAFGPDLAAHFRLPADPTDLGLDTLAVNAPRTPGEISAETLTPTPVAPDPTGPEPGSTDAAAWPLIVTEIAPDHAGADEYEFIEVHNPTSTDIDLEAGGYSFAYIYADSADRSRDKALVVPEPTVIAAGETILLWVSYTAGSVDSFARTADQFRAHWSVPETTQVVRITGQTGMANSAPRGIRVLRGDEIVSWSTYGRTASAPDLSAHFRIPASTTDPGMDILAEPAAPTPGVVTLEALTFPPFAPQPDPTVTTTPLQVTEILPDSTNVAGSDGYEFIELYNATATPIDFSDYVIQYLYPDSGAARLWPATPADVVIPAGGTLVFWIKNAANTTLGAADFNAAFGTDLVLGTDLVEISSAGMANGGHRGIAVATNTGHTINEAFYNANGADDTVADQGIRYTVSDDDPRRQRLLDIVAATPGTVQADQVPAGLMIVPPDVAAPTIVDHTAGQITPGADFPLSFTVTDDVLPRTVTLTIAANTDDTTTTVQLLDSGGGIYTHLVDAIDLSGKRWYEYALTARDGTNVTTLATRRVEVTGVDTSPVRLDLTDGQYVAGTIDVIAAGDTYPSDVRLSVDGTVVPTRPSLESTPTFVFEAVDVNYYFKNGVRIGDDVLNIFELGMSDWGNVITPIPLSYVQQGDQLTVSVWAGTKAAPEIDLAENNDDFDIRGLRLLLPDGRALTPAGYDDPTAVLRMGDSAGKYDFYDAVFTLPPDAFSANVATWDTTERPDGPIVVSASDGQTEVLRTVLVDNTAPVVTSEIRDVYQGEIQITAEVVDAGSGVASVTATLDGEPIPLPHTTSSVELAAGEHVLEIVAVDALGNTNTWTASFTTFEEQPSAGVLVPAEGAEVPAGEVTLQAAVSDPTGDVLDVAFLEGQRLDLADGDVDVRSGTVHDALTLDRSGGQLLSAAELGTLAEADGVHNDVSSDAAFPYQLFDVDATTAGAGAQVRATWTGRANAGATVILYAQRADGTGWAEVDRLVTGTDATSTTLDAVVPVDEFAVDGVVRLLVQHSEGFAGENLTDRTSAVTPHNPADVPRSDYDFTFAWESDTQYYNENTLPGEPYRHQQAIHSYLLDRRAELNLQYLFHTGDIIDDYDQLYQWDNADVEYQRLDDAALPYGILAGNHDVGNHLEDYATFSRYFGTERFADNPWYGGSYEDNRGHYDLISAGGIDFLMLYTGWLPDDESIAWMNEVLGQYPDRVAIVAQHEFILTTGGLGAIPQRVLDEVVAPNPNVRMVLSGHYHDAFMRTDDFDDDGDGTPDRTVYSMLFDYQGLPEGGLGYLRLLHFDNVGEQMMVRTYSPSLDDYNSDAPSLLGPADDPNVHQEFELSYTQLGIEPTVRTLGTDAFTAEILTTSEIARFDDVPSGSVLSATWSLGEPGEHGWYVRTSDPHGAVDHSRVSLFTVLAAPSPPEPTEPTEPGDDDPTQPGDGEPSAPGAGTDTSQPGSGTPDGSGTGSDGSETGPDGLAAGPDGLAATGWAASPVLRWAIGLILGGAALVMVARRRIAGGQTSRWTSR